MPATNGPAISEAISEAMLEATREISTRLDRLEAAIGRIGASNNAAIAAAKRAPPPDDKPTHKVSVPQNGRPFPKQLSLPTPAEQAKADAKADELTQIHQKLQQVLQLLSTTSQPTSQPQPTSQQPPPAQLPQHTGHYA